jgi:hydroxymethylpyrimidine pyrophosphatase-like HAD family hydrolase
MAPSGAFFILFVSYFIYHLISIEISEKNISSATRTKSIAKSSYLQLSFKKHQIRFGDAEKTPLFCTRF